jgi:two-component system LytT family sensor kinase
LFFFKYLAHSKNPLTKCGYPFTINPILQPEKVKAKDLPIFNANTMNSWLSKKRVLLFLWIGLAFWIVNSIHFFTSYTDTGIERTINCLWGVIYLIPLVYILFEYTFRFIRSRNIFLSILLLVGHIFTFACGMYLWRGLGVKLGIYTSLLVDGTTRGKVIEDQMAFSMMSVFFFGIVRHVYDHVQLRQMTQKLRIEKQEAELNYLRSQTNPHFLFNTLNNIYALSRDKSNLAPESIMRLSKILRYMLYETSGEYVAIEQELKIISDYIALEQLRYDESLQVNFNYDVEDMKQALPPLLLVPLVENAFKHGVSETRSRPFIDIHLSVKQRQLKLLVKNSTETAAGEVKVKENIGLSNLRRQLELLYKDYELSVQQGEMKFTATLKINLASHV